MTWLLLLRHWQLAALGLALVFAGVQTYRIDRLKADVRTERARHFATFVRQGGDLIMARVNIGTLRGAIDAQNLAIRQHEAESARRIQAAQEAIREARRAMPRVVERVVRLQAPIAATERLARFDEIDRRVLESLR